MADLLATVLAKAVVIVVEALVARVVQALFVSAFAGPSTTATFA